MNGPICVGACFFSPNFLQQVPRSYCSPPFSCFSTIGPVSFKTDRPGLTDEEIAICRQIGSLWTEWQKLDAKHPDDDAEFCKAVHDLQRMVAVRVARRIDKMVWQQPEDQTRPRYTIEKNVGENTYEMSAFIPGTDFMVSGRNEVAPLRKGHIFRKARYYLNDENGSPTVCVAEMDVHLEVVELLKQHEPYADSIPDGFSGSILLRGKQTSALSRGWVLSG